MVCFEVSNRGFDGRSTFHPLSRCTGSTFGDAPHDLDVHFAFDAVAFVTLVHVHILDGTLGEFFSMSDSTFQRVSVIGVVGQMLCTDQPVVFGRGDEGGPKTKNKLPNS